MPAARNVNDGKKRISLGFVSEYVPVGSSEQLSRFLLVKSQTCPPSLLELGRGRVRWIHLQGLLGHRFRIRGIVARCQRIHSALHTRSPTDSVAHNHLTNLVAKLCCCFTDLRFQRTRFGYHVGNQSVSR